jgi:DNA repair photolyase
MKSRTKRKKKSSTLSIKTSLKEQREREREREREEEEEECCMRTKKKRGKIGREDYGGITNRRPAITGIFRFCNKKMHTHFLFLKSEQCNKSALFSS